jgi:apolipoprotein N-acyltransferase
MEYQQQFIKALALAKPNLNAQTHYLVLPETFITNNINEKFLNESEELVWFRDSLIKALPNLKVITGGNTYEFYEDPSKVTSTARFDKNSGLHYDVYNSAVYIDATSSQVYHKSKLVPGVEKMPFPALFKPLENLALDLGGTVGSLGLQKERSVFKDETNQTAIAPVICYESVYSDYVSEYVRNGASLIFIVTNDGWWDDTPGYKQHLNYARLRAIENRRQIVRSANTGISCFLDELGNIYQPSKWWQEAVIAQHIYPNTELTFFSRFGDLISYSAVLFSSLLLLFYLFKRFFSKTGN